MPTHPVPPAVFKLELAGRPPLHLDAMLTHRRLDSACPDWWGKLNDLAATNRPLPPGCPPNFAAMRGQRRLDLASDLGQAVSKAFALSPVDPATGQGYTEDERLTALAQFLDFVTACQEASLPLAPGVGHTA